MSLTFAGGTDRIQFPTNARFDNDSVFSFITWVYLTSIPSGAERYTVFSRKATSDVGKMELWFDGNGTNARINFFQDRATSDRVYTGNLDLVAYQWYRICGSSDATVSPNLGIGTLPFLCVATAGATNSGGSGIEVSNSGEPFYVGNDRSLAAGFVGHISFLALYSNARRLDSLNWVADSRRPIIASQEFHYLFGYDGNGTNLQLSAAYQFDGVVYGATQGPHLPKPNPFAMWNSMPFAVGPSEPPPPPVPPTPGATLLGIRSLTGARSVRF